MPEHCKWDIRMVAVHGRRPGRSALPMWSGRWPGGPNFQVRSMTPSVYAIREHTVTSWQGPPAAQLRVQFQPEVCEQRLASRQKVGFVLLVEHWQREDASIAPHKKAWSLSTFVLWRCEYTSPDYEYTAITSILSSIIQNYNLTCYWYGCETWSFTNMWK